MLFRDKRDQPLGDAVLATGVLRARQPVNIFSRSRPVDGGPHDRFLEGEGGAAIGLLPYKCDGL
jgi:hypothetical protein